MTKRAWIIFAAISVLLLGGLVYLSSQNKLDVSDVNPDTIQEASEANGNIADHVYGNADSKVVLIEYGDFQCPGCGSAHPIVKEVAEKYKDDMALVFRNFPISTIHPNARVAAASAEAAGLQDKYWEMFDTIFENQSAWENANTADRGNIFAGYAREIGLDEDQFKLDIASSQVETKINYDLALGRKQNVNSTPTFFLNGEQIDQETYGTVESLSAAIEAEIAAQN